MLQWLTSLFARAKQPTDAQRWRAVERSIRARYDIAQTTEENSKQWGSIDYLSAASANTLGIRKLIKARAGYEISNNCWARGIVNRRANYLIGRGPRLQVRLPNQEDSVAVEKAWSEWVQASGFYESIRTMAVAKGGRCGEAFGLYKTRDEIPNPVKLWIRVIESDQVMTPNPGFQNAYWVDGVELNADGTPDKYHVLRRHPGDMLAGNMSPLEFDTIPAKSVIHWFRHDRPGQLRGLPEIAPALDLFGQLRRYTQATLMAAEIAASYAMFIKTNGAAENSDPIAAMSSEEIYRGLMTALPQGWEPFQLKSEQPATTFDMFEHALLVQVCSCLDIPFGIAIGDFSGSSYAGGRLDTQGFFKTIQVERKQCTETVVEPVFNEWLAEASRVPGLLPPSLSRIAFALDRRIATDVPHVWRWDSMPHIDIKKEIDSYAVAVSNNFCTRAYVAAEVFGLDGHDVIIERGQEASLEKENGVTVIVPGASVVNPEDGSADQVTSPDEVSEGVTTQ